MAEIIPAHKDEIPQPTSIHEVEELIKRLYLPGSPNLISKIQEALQQLQRSNRGWQLAHSLLNSNDDKIRFFGALTFVIKLNNDWDSLAQDSHHLLLATLISWLVRLVSRSEGPLVVRKLCSALVSYFLRPNVSWERCIRHVICSFVREEAVSLSNLDDYPPTLELTAQLNKRQIIATMWFSATLVEEVGKTDPDNIRKIRHNVTDLVKILQYVLDSCAAVIGNSTLQDKALAPGQEGIKCLQSWVFYSHRAWLDTAIELEPLKALTQPAIRCLMHEEMFEVTVELLTDILSNYPKFLSDQDIQALFLVFTSEWSQSRLKRLKDGDFDFDSVQFGRFLLAFGDITVQDLARAPEHPSSQHLMQMLHSLLACDGYAVAEDEICHPALEFWTTFIEFIIDSLFAEGEKKAAWMSPARANIVQAIEECWVKIRYPPPEVVASWDTEVRKGFKDFRTDVRDLLQSSYTFLGIEIFETFTDIAVRSLSNRAWAETETALFCLIALADCVADEDAEDSTLARLFGSAMFSLLVDEEVNVPVKARQTAVNMLGHYAAFFERHTEYLPAVLNFLFICLGDEATAPPASRSVASLCSSCRGSLTTDLEIFIQQYERFLSGATAEIGTKDRVIGAVSAIVQALPTEEAKAQPLRKLLGLIEQDVKTCTDSARLGNPEAAQDAGIAALRCLCSVGRSMQVPTDVPIDIDSVSIRSDFWDHGLGASIQAKIVEIVDTVTSHVGWSGEIIEHACGVYRSGFKETSPGPFVLAPHFSTAFILRSRLETPRLGMILTTACILLATHSTDSSTRIEQEACSLFAHVLGLMHQMQDPQKDPEVAQNCIDFIRKLIPRYMNVLLSVKPIANLEAMFMFIIKCLRGGEVLPKRSAASFWASLVTLTEEPADIQPTINEIVQYIGPILADALIWNIAGGALRTELDVVAEPLKKLISVQPSAKRWLEDSLSREDFPSTKVDAATKRIWLQKVMKLRGAKGTNQAVKDFWIACRGTNMSYIS
ncbi:MAG: hypothetical protein M1835_006254 [Candelina submexicana]|nr:MAG: hypothetical protein M1835_006254 [Candelina submexicana]